MAIFAIVYVWIQIADRLFDSSLYARTKIGQIYLCEWRMAGIVPLGVIY